MSLKNQLKVLVVDDDPIVRQSMSLIVPEGWEVTLAEGPDVVPSGVFHAAIVDMHLTADLSKPQGLDVIRALVKRQPNIEVVAMSGDFRRPLMEATLKAGASRFLAKPLQESEFRLTLEKIEALHRLLEASHRRIKKGLKWIGSSKQSREVLHWISQMKGEVGPLLIEGESGTGKEVVAHLLNQQEPHRPFVCVNVAAIPENLFESELFGHVKGAFTGADQNKVGLAEVAANGDLFLDEVEALTPGLQVKLLRFLESGEVRRVGAKESFNVDVRVIAASNENLEQLVNEKKFREDLYFRLKGKQLILPPLRSRETDLIQIAQFFLDQDRSRRRTLGEDAREALSAHHWPGNVRELKRVIEQLVLLSPLPIIRAEDVQRALGKAMGPQSESAPELNLNLNLGLSQLMSEFESRVIAASLNEKGDIEDAARKLQISRSSLYKKISDHQIEWKKP